MTVGVRHKNARHSPVLEANNRLLNHVQGCCLDNTKCMLNCDSCTK